MLGRSGGAAKRRIAQEPGKCDSIHAKEGLIMADQARPSIALLAAPETSPSVLYGLYDVLLSVGAVYADMTAGQPRGAACRRMQGGQPGGAPPGRKVGAPRQQAVPLLRQCARRAAGQRRRHRK